MGFSPTKSNFKLICQSSLTVKRNLAFVRQNKGKKINQEIKSSVAFNMGEAILQACESSLFCEPRASFASPGSLPPKSPKRTYKCHIVIFTNDPPTYCSTASRNISAVGGFLPVGEASMCKQYRRRDITNCSLQTFRIVPVVFLKNTP